MTFRLVTLCAACGLLASAASAQTVRGAVPGSALQSLNADIEALTAQVSRSVVQVLVTGYRPVEDADRSDADVVIGRQRSLGSGVIIDPDGYILTNAHVVAGAQRVRVVLRVNDAATNPLESLATGHDQTLPAKIAGVARDLDLALLKIDTTGLQALPLADYDRVRQGELVFAFGNPEGLRNSVTMGVISSAARQLDPDSPNVYVQTDAPINPGNSGGPLVNVQGEVVGLNTFIFSETGGSQGLGFAIPSAVIGAAYPQLRQYGHLHRGVIGVSVQAINPVLAEHLELPRSSGVLVSDVDPDSPADAANVGVGDIVTSINGKPIDSVPLLNLSLSTLRAGDTVTLGILRKTQALSLKMTVAERPHAIDQLVDLGDPEKNAIPKLGIVAVDVDALPQALADTLRDSTGVLVTARRQDFGGESPLMAGDVIHAVNAFTVRSVAGLQALLDSFKSAGEVVLQIERDRRLMFVTVPID